MERRLSAILAADVAGYSRLMGANEVATLDALTAHRTEVIDISVSDHGGRVVKLTGDGIIAEFPSVVSAVQCAAGIQDSMMRRNADVPEDRRIQFRIGVNAGDIIVQDGDIYGDGVNVAARIEALARPGGIALSGTARDHIGNKLDFAFEDAGEQHLKNIALPVRVFHLVLGSSSSRSVDSAAPSKPSIGVLPFANMSGDSEQEYFADGITEDLITDLSKISALFVVGRNSVFTYKGRAVDLRQAAKELGVRYILEGSVRKAGNTIRITAQLIDGSTGGHLWADRYDRALTDIFALQDEITKTVVKQLEIRLLSSESDEISQSSTRNVEAYTYYLRGRQLYHMRVPKYVELGRRMFEKAADLDPDYARAYAGIADCNSFLKSWFGTNVPVEEILATANKALELDPKLAEAHAARGLALVTADRVSEAGSSLQHALSIDPLCYEAHYYYARYCVVRNDPQGAATHFIRALEIRPDDYRAPLLLDAVYRNLGREDERTKYVELGLKRAEEAIARHPDNPDPLELGAAVLAARGEAGRSRDWLERALLVDPDVSKPRYNIACAYSQLGEVDLAIDLLEQSIGTAGPEVLKWLTADPDMDPVRGHPRYTNLLDTYF